MKQQIELLIRNYRRVVIDELNRSLDSVYNIVHDDLVFCHTSIKTSTFSTRLAVQMLLPCTLVITEQLPWDPPATHFPIPEVTHTHARGAHAHTYTKGKDAIRLSMLEVRVGTQ